MKYLIFLLVVLAGCNKYQPGVPETGSRNEPSNTLSQDIVKRVLAEPTADEIQNVLDALRQQSLLPTEVVSEKFVKLTNGNQLTVVSHRIAGRLHYGAVVVPPSSGSEKLPVILMACGGDGMSPDVDVATIFNQRAVQYPQFLGGGLDAKCIVAIPSFRGQKLIVDGAAFQSEGNIGDAFDGATTDTIAFLNVVLSLQELADSDRIAIVGGSRGGTVALLASARDKRIKKAVVIAAPTNMKELYELYPGQFQLLFFGELMAGDISELEARKKYISSSPNFFCGELPKVQIHHDKNDPFVPFRFATDLVESMNKREAQVELHTYDEQIHGFWEAPSFWKNVQAFLEFE